MPDPSLMGWVAAGVVGSAFMWLLKLHLAHVEADLARLYKTAERGTELAERAAVSLARSAGARQAFDVFWQYGCRDGSLIGHRAIARERRRVAGR